MASASRRATILLRAAAKCQSLRPAALLEIAAFAQATKPSLRFVVSAEDSAILQCAAIELGCATCSRSIFLSAVSGSWNDIVAHRTSRQSELVVIADNHNADRLLEAELSNSTEAGTLLGYPKCCVTSLPRLAASPERWPLTLLSTGGSRVDARLNRFAAEWGGIGLIGELFPCSLHCRAAASYAQSLYDAAQTLGLAKLAGAAKSDALESVTISTDGLIHRTPASGAATVEFFW